MALKPKIQALIDYANGTTGAGDVTLGDAVKTLAEGYVREFPWNQLVRSLAIYENKSGAPATFQGDVLTISFAAQSGGRWGILPLGVNLTLGHKFFQFARVKGSYSGELGAGCQNHAGYGWYRRTYNIQEGIAQEVGYPFVHNQAAAPCDAFGFYSTASYGACSVDVESIGVFDLTAMGIEEEVNNIRDFKSYLVKRGLMDSVDSFIPNFPYDKGSMKDIPTMDIPPLVIPSGEMSAKLAALLAYSNEVTGAGDTRMGDAIKTLCDGWGGGSSLSDEAKAYATQYGVLSALEAMCAEKEGLADIVNEWPQIIHSLEIGTGHYNSLRVTVPNGVDFKLHEVSNQGVNLDIKFYPYSIPNTWCNLYKLAGVSATDTFIFLGQFGRSYNSLYLYTAQRSYALARPAQIWQRITYQWGEGFVLNGSQIVKTETPTAHRENFALIGNQAGTIDYAYAKFSNDEVTYHYVPFTRDGNVGMMELNTGDFFPVPSTGQIDLLDD